VEVSHLFEVVWVSLAAGVFVTAAFSFVVLGSARSAEARRTGRGAASIAFAALALLAFLAFAAVVVFGVNVMVSKD
jgi:tetrahydromethanopterin S-methyltransferase subunit D